MAVTKVFAIRVRLDDRVRYITDGEKTSLASGITYISNPEKTEQFFFTSALNCSSVDTVLSEMMETKQQFGKMGGVLGYHFIQSFQPGEVTPEQAHAIGLEFAKRLFGKRYEVVISTHLNKHHLHNHLVVNSVSCIDGQKYHSSPESYYNDVRGTSDALCRENDLSVITPQGKGKGKHYAEWKAEQGGKPTVRGVICADIDAIIHQAYTYDTFLMLLRKNGYEVRRSPNQKYTTVKPPGAKRAIRLDSLGEGYTEADIMARLSKQRHGGMAPLIIAHTVKRYRMKGKLATVRKKKITGFHALYLRYLYLLRGGRRKKLPPKLPFSVKREVIHLERYEQQFKYLLSSGITTETELEQRIRVLEWDIRLLEEQRKPLYQERRNASDEETQTRYSTEIERQTAALREKRGELRLCRRIQSDIPRVSQQCQQAQAERQENLKNKEEHEHEYQR
ncbi:relaxase/mobilization nuclease domain-containing protein [Dysosmobacter sp.]|uniref:relaxase/mobilization nuclease domain-containing protein n=1 Tax=Dysosmobacter sp. TaxID=2591382 RepID=UPI003AB31F1A